MKIVRARYTLCYERANLILFLIPTLTREGSPGCWQEQDILLVSVSLSTEQWAKLFQKAWMPHRWTQEINESSAMAHLVPMFLGGPVQRQGMFVSKYSYCNGCDCCYLSLQMLLFAFLFIFVYHISQIIKAKTNNLWEKNLAQLIYWKDRQWGLKNAFI